MSTQKPLPKYVFRQERNGGRVYHYFRRQGLYTRLPDDPASHDFAIRYGQLLESISLPSAKAMKPGSVKALIAEFKRAPEFLSLESKTQTGYARSLDKLAIALGEFQARRIKRHHIIRIRNAAFGGKRRAADDFVAAVSRTFSIGVDLGYCDTNPAARIKRIADSESYLPWPEAARDRFERSNPPPHLLTGYTISVWTGMRLGDVLKLARTRYDGAGFSVRYRKTRKSNPTDGYIPAFSKLRAYIADRAWPHLLFITTDTGEQFDESTYGKQFAKHLLAIGLDGYTFHGLRHSTGKALAEAGATDAEIQAILMHKTRQMVERYTKGARQKNLAESAMAKLEKGRA